MPIRIEELERTSDHEWHYYVALNPQATFFHTLIWRDAVEEAFGHQSRYLIARRDGRCVGVFPLARVDSVVSGTILVSVPYGVYGGTLADDDEAHDALLQQAKALADSLGARWMDIRSAERRSAELPVVERYVTFKRRLPDDPDRVLAEMPRKARAAARQARDRYRLEARFDDGGLDVVWSLYSQSMRRLGSLNYPIRFFRALLERTPGRREPLMNPDEHRSMSDDLCSSPSTVEPGHRVQLIMRDGRPIAGLLSFIYRGTMMPYFAGCAERFEKYHPNHFMYMTAMQEAVRIGCTAFDFGRSRVDNKGTYDFKRFQGFEPTPLHYQYYVPQGGSAPNLHPMHPQVALARRVWPRLPLGVTRPLGAWLSKSIPG